MRIAALFTTLVASASLGAYAQAVNESYVAAVLSALNAANLTALAGAAQAVANTSEGRAFFAALPGSNKTLFAPTNEAFAGVPSNVSSNTTLLANILSYHVLNVSISNSSIAKAPNHTIARSLYNNGLLPGNASQPVVFNLANNTQTGNQTNNTQTGNQTGNHSLAFPYQHNATVFGSSQPLAAANFLIYPIYAVLSLPQTLGELATSLLPSLAGVISQAGLLEPLSNAKGITVFAPNDAAVAAAGSLIGTLNGTQIQSVLSNHVINGSVVYSTLLASSNYTSAGGEAFNFSTNATGTFVTSGNTTAQILFADIPIANGVVHVIDRILANPITNTGAAQSAASSYASVATATTSGGNNNGGGVIGATTMGSATSGAASGSATKTGGTSGAMPSVPFSTSVFGSAVAILAGIFAGAALI